MAAKASRYGLGVERSLAAFEEFAGVNFTSKCIDTKQVLATGSTDTLAAEREAMPGAGLEALVGKLPASVLDRILSIANK